MVYHFGVKVLEGKRGLRLTREKYAIVDNKSSFGVKDMLYNDQWCEKHLINCLENFDLNMEYFSLLNHSEFCVEIEKFLKQNNYFTEVDDLNLYIGTTGNVKKRVRQHWSISKSFDRLIFGNVDSSILSIDSFRALDTTRIYVYETNETFSSEDKFINEIPVKFICNRMAGGRIEGGLLQAITMRKTRNLKK